MQVFFISQNLKYSVFKYFFKRIEIKKDKLILNCNIDKMKLKKKIKIVKKISKILNKNNSNTVIISSKLKKDIFFTDLLYSEQLNIITGKKMFKTLIEKILEKTILEHNIKKEETEIALAANSKNEWVCNLIINLSKKFKSVKIVSNNIKYFKEIEEKLFENEGIIVTVTNNKRKAMLKSNIILNIDFSEEQLNKYNIYENSIIISVEDNIKIHKKRFSGIIINDYNIKLRKEGDIFKDLTKDEYKEFSLKDLAECYITGKPEEIKNIEVY